MEGEHALTLLLMELKQIFKNEHHELRPGWQLLLFILAWAIATAAAVAPFILLKRTDVFSLSAATLVGALAATYAVTRLINRKPIGAVGLTINSHTMRQLGIGCLAGFLMMTGIFGFEYLLGYVTVVAPEISYPQAFQTFGIAIVFFVVGALSEEVLFRGYPFQTLVRGVGFVPAVIIGGILFGVAHLGNPNANAFAVINIVLVSVLFSLAYWRTRSLWLPFGIHFAWNFAQTTLYGFPTSGVHFTHHELTRLTQFGPEWLTGGPFGPEAGAFATLMILLCGMYVYFSEALRPAPNQATLERDDEHLTAQIFERKAA
ncbi:MAG: CPBP family intramembrane metalloprotease [Ignavibacteriae bacterium]|nr:CPBP family intramembrane metalloprotease [Ignavibacteriota bacterium]